MKSICSIPMTCIVPQIYTFHQSHSRILGTQSVKDDDSLNIGQTGFKYCICSMYGETQTGKFKNMLLQDKTNDEKMVIFIMQ